MFVTRYQDVEYCFYDDRVTVGGSTLLYSEMVDIAHKNGKEPAFVFTYGGRRITLPYDSQERNRIMPYFIHANKIEPKMSAEQAGVKAEQPTEMEAAPEVTHEAVPEPTPEPEFVYEPEEEVVVEQAPAPEPAPEPTPEPEFVYEPEEEPYVEPAAEVPAEPEFVYEPEQPAEPAVEAPAESEFVYEQEQPEQEVYTEPEPTVEQEAYVEAEPEAYAEPEQEVYAEPEPTVEQEAYVEPEPEAYAEPEQEVYTEPEPTVEQEAYVEPEPEAYAEPEAPAEPELAPDSEQSAEPEQTEAGIKPAKTAGVAAAAGGAKAISGKFKSLPEKFKAMPKKTKLICAIILALLIAGIILLCILMGTGKSVDGMDGRITPKPITTETGDTYKISMIDTDIDLNKFAPDYYKKCFKNGDTVHWVINNKTSETIMFADHDGTVLICVFDHVEGEQEDPSLLGSGSLKETWIMYPDMDELVQV